MPELHVSLHFISFRFFTCFIKHKIKRKPKLKFKLSASSRFTCQLTPPPPRPQPTLDHAPSRTNSLGTFIVKRLSSAVPDHNPSPCLRVHHYPDFYYAIKCCSSHSTWLTVMNAALFCFDFLHKNIQNVSVTSLISVLLLNTIHINIYFLQIWPAE